MIDSIFERSGLVALIGISISMKRHLLERTNFSTSRESQSFILSH